VEDDEEFGTESESGVESMAAEAKKEGLEKGAEEMMYAEAKKEGPSAAVLFHTRVISLHWTSIRSVVACSSRHGPDRHKASTARKESASYYSIYSPPAKTQGTFGLHPGKPA
jgi:hypothetical protein